MTYPVPNKTHPEPFITVLMSTMEASWILRILRNHKPTDSSENAHMRMTIEKIEEEFRRIKDEREGSDDEERA